jgi:DNA repair protein RecN (Recombination protein N)
MLLTLQIENIAIIEHLELSLENGLTVLSGETGAGKSILIEAINALVGGRTSRDLIRTGAERASVQGLFLMPDTMPPLLETLGIEPSGDGTLLLQRSFTDSGRNACRINGSLVTAGVLRAVGEKLLDIHGQHDNQSLFRTETHIGLLDAFAGETFRKGKQRYDEEYAKYRQWREELRQVSGSERERERRIDMLRFQLDELDKASLKPGEDVELEKRSLLLAHAETIVASFAEAYEMLSGEASGEAGARDRVRRSVTVLRRVAHVSKDFADMADQLSEISERLDELSREVVDVRDGTEFDPHLRDRIEDRLSFLQAIRKKYGESVDECIRYRDDTRIQLAQLADAETLIAGYTQRLKEQTDLLHGLCADLSRLRREAAGRLAAGMSLQLADLEMPKALFEAAVVPETEREFDENGLDRVEFLFTANLGEPLKPLSRIASGGEMSRVMLAIKTMLADVDRLPTLVFDEIDAGVGGKAAQKVGEKLAELAASRQILCVTHHAQIASLADYHHQIGKEQSEGRTRTRVSRLSGQALEDEITRLLSGAHRTETAHGLARELLARGAASRAAANSAANPGGKPGEEGGTQ